MSHSAEAEAHIPPPVPLRVHFSDVVDKTWPELRTRFMALLPSLAPDSQILVTEGAGPCPSDTHLFVAGGAAITADNLRPAVGAGNLKGVIHSSAWSAVSAASMISVGSHSKWSRAKSSTVAANRQMYRTR